MSAQSPLRDARLVRALAHAPPDDAAATHPGAATREAVREMARRALGSVAAPAAHSPAGARWRLWTRWLGGAGPGTRASWGAAFATLALTVLVTSLWHDRDVPGPTPDGPQVAGSRPPRQATDPAERQTTVAERAPTRTGQPSATGPGSAPAPAPRPASAAPAADTPPAQTPSRSDEREREGREREARLRPAREQEADARKAMVPSDPARAEPPAAQGGAPERDERSASGSTAAALPAATGAPPSAPAAAARVDAPVPSVMTASPRAQSQPVEAPAPLARTETARDNGETAGAGRRASVARPLASPMIPAPAPAARPAPAPAWDQLVIAGGSRVIEVPRERAGSLGDLVSEALRSPEGSVDTGELFAAIVLRQDGNPVGRIEVGPAGLRWRPAQGGGAVRSRALSEQEATRWRDALRELATTR